MKSVSVVRFLAIPAAVFLGTLATSSVASACSREVSPISVGPSFTVRVSGYDGPVKGLVLNLTDPQQHVRSAVTDRDGIAHFQDVARGTRFLRADHDNGFAEQLDVRPDGPANVNVPIRWPSIKPIHVRSLSGTMRAPDAVPGQLEQRQMSLELLEGISGKVLSSLDTTSRGGFDFGELGPGLYFIHLKPFSAFREKVEVDGGLIGIAVDPASPSRAEKLDLNVNWTSCGLEYMDLLHCPQLDLHVKKLEGHASDSLGRGVRDLQIVLLDNKQKQVAHVSTDTSGDFTFPGPLTGTFEFRIDGTGITPIHTVLHIEPTADGPSMEIQAGYGTGCSTVRVK